MRPGFKRPSSSRALLSAVNPADLTMDCNRNGVTDQCDLPHRGVVEREPQRVGDRGGRADALRVRRRGREQRHGEEEGQPGEESFHDAKPSISRVRRARSSSWRSKQGWSCRAMPSRQQAHWNSVAK